MVARAPVMHHNEGRSVVMNEGGVLLKDATAAAAPVPGNTLAAPRPTCWLKHNAVRVFVTPARIVRVADAGVDT